MGHLEPFVLMGQPPPRTCPECAVDHDPDQPHNRQSLFYQYKFYNEWGRWPTWDNAMAHCSDEVKTFWVKALKQFGIVIEA